MTIVTDKIPPVHPGEVLREEFLKPWNISQKSLAHHMGITPSRLNAIVRGRCDITGETALRLARATNTTPEFWLNLQTLYDLETAKDALGDRLEQITPIPAARTG
jgi:addiction module HigA family antidote